METDLRKCAELCRDMRRITGCGIMSAKKCLVETSWDMNKALEYYKENQHIFRNRRVCEYRKGGK